jgi:hypothetical protein
MNYPPLEEASKQVEQFFEMYKIVAAQMKAVDPSVSPRDILEATQLIFDT